jgi:predicted nucleic acid-binding protein
VAMGAVLVDSNVLIDVVHGDPVWFDWSRGALEAEAERSLLVINPIIYAEVSHGFDRMADLDFALPAGIFHRESLPWPAAFVAAKVHGEYRRRGGTSRTILADLLVGAHALVTGMAVLTRDARRYRGYYPTLELIAPDG